MAAGVAAGVAVAGAVVGVRVAGTVVAVAVGGKVVAVGWAVLVGAAVGVVVGLSLSSPVRFALSLLCPLPASDHAKKETIRPCLTSSKVLARWAIHETNQPWLAFLSPSGVGTTMDFQSSVESPVSVGVAAGPVVDAAVGLG